MTNYRFLSAVACALLLSACNNGANEITYTNQLGDPCTEVAQCLDGLFCENGICRKLCNDDSDCLKTYQCIEKRCVVRTSEEPEGTDNNPGTNTEVTDSCGNGEENTNEQCDDHNKVSGDGCSAKCNIEKNYECEGWPSNCHCKEGFQDSNSDGLCQQDCQSCGENSECQYSADGKATGCGCLYGYQDSNSDGHCLPDCRSCEGNMVCQYDSHGQATCGCPEGTQDNDHDNTCMPACIEDSCGDYQSCNDESGTIECSCTIYVTPEGGFAGASWDKPASLNQAIMSASTQMLNDQELTSCYLWLSAGTHEITNQLVIDNLNIYGGFSKGDRHLAQRDSKKNQTKLQNKGLTTSMLLLNESKSALLDGLFITGGQSSTGGAIYTSGSLTINDTIFYNNSAFMKDISYGGAIYKNGGILTISNCDFANNSAAFHGAISNNSGEIIITNSIFSGNNAQSSGGAIYNTSKMNIDSTIFINNYLTKTEAGAKYGTNIYNGKESNMLINNSQFLSSKMVAGPKSSTGTNMPAYGNAIYQMVGKSLIINSVFSDLINQCTDKTSSCKGTVIHHINEGGTVEFYHSLINNQSLSNSSIASSYSNTTVNFKNNLIQKPDGKDAFAPITLDSSNIRDFKYVQTNTGLSWNKAVYDVNTNRTTLTCEKAFWQEGSLVGQYVVDNSSFEINGVLLPILENGTNYVVIPSDPRAFKILKSELDNNSTTTNSLYNGKDIIFQNLRDLDESSYETIIDQADMELGDIENDLQNKDLFGTSRPQGQGNDIGPVEIR